jgi:hypothetical protein
MDVKYVDNKYLRSYIYYCKNLFFERNIEEKGLRYERRYEW